MNCHYCGMERSRKHGNDCGQVESVILFKFFFCRFRLFKFFFHSILKCLSFLLDDFKDPILSDNITTELAYLQNEHY